MTEPRFSFEFFPPQSDKAAQKLVDAATMLTRLNPRFLSVTYGAGGSTRARTHETVLRLHRETGVEVAAHLTCVGASRDAVDAIARRYLAAGIGHIVALRGDVPTGTGPYRPDPAGYAYASDLVTGLRKLGEVEISVAAYPETHPDAISPKADLDNLKRKIDAGAVRAITQFFFEAETYFRFIERARTAGIAAEIIPGILPVTDIARACEFAQKCGASVPKAVIDTFIKAGDDKKAKRRVAFDQAAGLCDALRAGGVNAFHFYTLNRADLVTQICRTLET